MTPWYVTAIRCTMLCSRTTLSDGKRGTGDTALAQLPAACTSAFLVTASTMTATRAFSFSATAVLALMSFKSASACSDAADSSTFLTPSSTCGKGHDANDVRGDPSPEQHNTS